MRLSGGRGKAPIEVAAGERVLAWAATDRGPIGGTRDAFYLPDGPVPWERLQAADWDLGTTTLRVSEVGTWGEARPEHAFVVEEPGRLLELVRERITASVVLQRHVPLEGRSGLRVIARRAPRGDQPVTWIFEYDDGVDPEDPLVRIAAEETLAAARAELGGT